MSAPILPSVSSWTYQDHDRATVGPRVRHRAAAAMLMALDRAQADLDRALQGELTQRVGGGRAVEGRGGVPNGTVVNGMEANGMEANGMEANGMEANGSVPNGTGVDGVLLNDAPADGAEAGGAVLGRGNGLEGLHRLGQQAERVAGVSALEQTRALMGGVRQDVARVLAVMLDEEADPMGWADALPDPTGIRMERHRDARRDAHPVPGAAWSVAQKAALASMDVASRGLIDTLVKTVDRAHRAPLAAMEQGWTALERAACGYAVSRGVPAPNVQARAPRHPFDAAFLGAVVYLAHTAHGVVGGGTVHQVGALHAAVMAHLTDAWCDVLETELAAAVQDLASAGFVVGALASATAPPLPPSHNAFAGTAEAPANARAPDARDGRLPAGREPMSDEALFGSLCDLLQGWEPTDEDMARVTQLAEEGMDMELPALTPAETSSVIAVLQTMVPPGLAQALGLGRGRIAAEIKDALSAQARSQGLSGAISADDEHAVDLVDEAVDGVVSSRRLQDAARAILARILFPSVKAAMLDRGGFADESHPARGFIGAVTDAVAPADGAPRQENLAKAAEMVDSLVANFTEDVSIFAELAKDIREHLAGPSGRANEIDPSGLGTARSRRRAAIAAELDALWRPVACPDPVRSFARALGTEHLAVLDEAGERGGGRWQSALQALATLLTTRSAMGRRVRIDGSLRVQLLSMLATCGWTGVRAHSLLAEQEDIIHAYYVLGQTAFANALPPLNAEPLRIRPSGEAVRTGGDLTGGDSTAAGTASTGAGPTGAGRPRPSATPSSASSPATTSSGAAGERPTGGSGRSGAPLATPSTTGAPATATPSAATTAAATTAAATTGAPSGVTFPVSARSSGAAVVARAAVAAVETAPDRAEAVVARPSETEAPQSNATVVLNTGVKEVSGTERGAVEQSTTGQNERTTHPTTHKQANSASSEGDRNGSDNVVPFVRPGSAAPNAAALPGAGQTEQHNASEALRSAGARPTTPNGGSDAARAPALHTPAPNAAGANESINEQAIHDRVIGMAIDTWSTWINALGASEAVRLSWISPLSSKYLFVDRRGARVLVGTPRELTALALQGRFFPGLVP